MSKKKRNEPQPLPSERSQVEKLEKENRMLKIENAYLKELRRLRLEDEQNERIARIIHSLRRHFRLKIFWKP